MPPLFHTALAIISSEYRYANSLPHTLNRYAGCGIPISYSWRLAMSKIYEDNSLTIGHTPPGLDWNRIGNGRILAKVESRNPSFSVKMPYRCQYDLGCRKTWRTETRR